MPCGKIYCHPRTVKKADGLAMVLQVVLKLLRAILETAHKRKGQPTFIGWPFGEDWRLSS
jgi:hypothetical protein